MSNNKANGYNRNLYRSRKERMLAGVCGGLAEYFDVAVWVARLVAITLFIFTQQLFVIGYIAAIFLLKKRPEGVSSSVGKTEGHGFHYQEPATKRLGTLQSRLEGIDKRIRNMERYVTSEKYRFNKELNDL